MLGAELTHHIVQAKALADEQGQWPQTLPDLDSRVCVGEKWIYEVNPKGEMSIAFSQNIDKLNEAGDLPFSYQAALVK